jgi:co-chaperonin GroES (HSP10)
MTQQKGVQMIKNIDEILKEDLGIDFETYSLEEEIAKYNGVDPSGYQLLIRVYVPKKITKIGNLFLPDESIDKLNQDAKFTNLTGLVVKIAVGVYKDQDRYMYTGPYCQIGDWVQFPRASGHSFAHNGLTSIYMTEDYILGKVKDPRTITRITA